MKQLGHTGAGWSTWPPASLRYRLTRQGRPQSLPIGIEAERRQSAGAES